MSVILLILLNISAILMVYNSIRNKSLSVLFWISLFIFFNIPHTLDLIGNYNSIYRETTLNEASLFAALFNIIFLILTYINNMINTNNNTRFRLFDKSITNYRFHWFQLIFLFISLLIWWYGLHQVSGRFIGFSWTDMRSVNPLYALIGDYVFLASVGCVFVFFYLKKKKFLVVSFVITLVFIFLLKSRANIIPFITPFLLYFLYKNRLNFRKVSKALLVGISIIFLVFFLQQYRYLGNIESIEFNTIIEVTQDTVENITEGGGEFNLRNGFYLFLENENNFINFNEGNTYKRLLLLPFPSRIVTFKPHDFAYDMYNAINPARANQGGSYHPIFYGDAYGNFGFLGFSVAFLWFFIFKFIDKSIRYFNPSVSISLLAPISLMYILLARGAVYNSVAFLFWSGIIILIINIISKFRWKATI